MKGDWSIVDFIFLQINLW